MQESMTTLDALVLLVKLCVLAGSIAFCFGFGWRTADYLATRPRRKPVEALGPSDPQPDPPTPPANWREAGRCPACQGPIYLSPLPVMLPRQAVRLRSGDRAAKDADVQALMASRRFQCLVGGRAGDGDRRQA